ncbi:MAG TPA: SDR family NAD(P)-dependent oxidoreductase [Burkholderiaceae bacterium]|nr:SDR family NAD(P)-dependent oxidoreductase [Burkholderiaceae bacterium]
MSFAFPDRRVIVCGGSRGIGRAIALAFANAGADVSVCARGRDALAATRDEIARHGHRAHAATCDLADAASVARYVAEAGAALGGIDVLVNNASGFGMGDDEAGWAAGLAVDVMAMVRASHAAIALLAAGRDPSIVHISSIAGLRPSTRTPAYAAVKAAMISYTASQAAMLAPKRIRVNCIAPGSIEFDGGVWDQRRKAGDPLYEHVLKSIPFGRLGTPQEVAEVALFLASTHARWVTGQTLAVDGGQLLAG